MGFMTGAKAMFKHVSFLFSPTVNTFLLLFGFTKFGGQSIFDGKGWVLDGFILEKNWQWCQLKLFPQGNVDFPIESRRVVLSFLRWQNVAGLP